MAAAASRRTRNAGCAPPARGARKTAGPGSRGGGAVYAPRAVDLPSQPEWGSLTLSKAGVRLYCIVRRWPADERLVVPVKSAVRRARALGSQRDVPIATLDGQPVIDLSRETAVDPHASVFVLDIGPAEARAADRAWLPTRGR